MKLRRLAAKIIDIVIILCLFIALMVLVDAITGNKIINELNSYLNIYKTGDANQVVNYINTYNFQLVLIYLVILITKFFSAISYFMVTNKMIKNSIGKNMMKIFVRNRSIYREPILQILIFSTLIGLCLTMFQVNINPTKLLVGGYLLLFLFDRDFWANGLNSVHKIKGGL